MSLARITLARLSTMIPSCRAVRSVSLSAAHATNPARNIISKDTRIIPSPLMDPHSLVLYKDGTWPEVHVWCEVSEALVISLRARCYV